LKFTGHHLEYFTSGYLLTSDYHQYSIRGISVTKSVGVAVGGLFPTGVELKIYYMSYAVHKLYLLLAVVTFKPTYWHLVGARHVLFLSTCSPVIFMKIHHIVSVNLMRL